MPVLDPKFISSWWYLTDSAGNIRLLESYEEEQKQEVTDKPLLQGDVGVHAKDIKGNWWDTSLKSPVLIIEALSIGDTGGTGAITGVLSIFDLLASEFTQVQQNFSPTLPTTDALDGISVTGLNHLLSNATITITENNVDIGMNMISTVPNLLNPTMGPLPSGIDFIGRMAKGFLDVQLAITIPSLTVPFTNLYQVKSGTITFSVEPTKSWFIGRGAKPYLSVQGYSVTANLIVMADPTTWTAAALAAALLTPAGVPDAPVIIDQPVGVLDTSRALASIGLTIGNTDNATTINLGNASVTTSMKRALRATETTTLDLKFSIFAHYTSPIS